MVLHVSLTNVYQLLENKRYSSSLAFLLHGRMYILFNTSKLSTLGIFY
jgi:hypothetical protein